MRGKLIIIEGTDCSGKETQSNLCFENLKSKGYKIFKEQFPRYDSATGKIIGGPYLGKEGMSESYFKEGAANVPSKVASLYYAADRLYNIDIINEKLESGINVILDRYVESNMAHQGAKLKSKEEREELWNFLDKLEFDLLNLPRPDAVIFLHMPLKQARILKEKRIEKADGHECDVEHLKNAENAYLELKEKYGFKYISCIYENENIKSIEDINKEVLNVVERVINGK